ncbi:MAG: patatin-like phospholipase RssA [Gammaproteobacteria bacterium]|nr:patatin-like phospholipase RssA [Gammaproteobacteria bacterium]MCW8922664.1 patatin-like phospholipase RssA [Gammaproteobacteria bacterium]
MSDLATNNKSIKNGIDNSRIGIALGSGSARGWSHIGVLQALNEIGIEPDIVAGSSIGALVGAAYASDQLDEMEAMVTALEWTDIVGYLDMSVIGGGLVQGEKIAKFLRQHVNHTDIKSMPRRFAAVATDLNNGSEVWLQEGDLLDAVRASVALPGLFTPFKHNDRWLVDGGLVDPVPVSLCRAMGADIVIAVSLNADIVGKHLRNNHTQNHSIISNEAIKENEQPLWDRISDQLDKTMQVQKSLLLSRLFGDSLNAPGLIDVLAGSLNIMQDRITRSRMAGDPPDIILSPRLAHFGLMEFDRGEIAIAEGRACVDRMRSALEYVFQDK